MSLVKDWIPVNVGGINMTLQDIASSLVRRSVAADICNDVYGLNSIQFRDDDVVIDIGANIGMVSIYLARRFPKIRVLAFEPVPENFNSFMANIWANGVGRTVKAQQLAVTKDGRVFDMIAHLGSNSGGATGFLRDMDLKDHDTFAVRSTTLDQIFEEFKIDRCRLLKVDCEGAEYEILTTAKCLSEVDYLSMEVHTNRVLQEQWGPPDLLPGFCAGFIDPNNIRTHIAQMAE